MSYYNEDENFWYDKGFSPYFKLLINTADVIYLMNIESKLLECEDWKVKYYVNKLENFNTKNLECLELELFNQIYDFAIFTLDQL